MTAAAKPAAKAPDSRRLAINFALLSIGEFTAKLLTFAVFSRLAHILGAEHYGTIEFVLAVIIFFTLPADLGLGSYGAREVARNRSQAPALLREILATRMCLAAGSFVLLMLFILVLHKSLETKILLGLYGVSLLMGTFMLQWFCQAHDQMHWVAIASIIRQTVFAIGVFLFLKPGTPIIWMGVFECASVAAVGLFCLFAIRRMGYALPRPSFYWPRLLMHLRAGAPIGATELAWAFMWYFGTVLLGLVFADDSLGWFGASHRLLMALHTFVWLYFFNLLPSISRCVALPKSRLAGLMQPSLNFTAWTSIFGAFFTTAIAREVLTIIYGPEFGGAAGSLSVLIWMLPVAMLSGHYRYILIGYGYQGKLLQCTVASAAIAVFLGCGLVPLFGATGASWALLIANLANFVMVYYAVQRHVQTIPFHPQLLHPLLATAAAGILFHMLSPMNVWAAVSAASLLYGSILAASQGRNFVSFLQVLKRKDQEMLVEEVVR